MRIALFVELLVVLAACTPVHEFSPISEASFAPRDTQHPIVFYETPPDTTYDVIGYAECRGEGIGEAMPYLKKLARQAGGDALMDVKETQVFLALYNYRAAVIRYK